MNALEYVLRSLQISSKCMQLQSTSIAHEQRKNCPQMVASIVLLKYTVLKPSGEHSRTKHLSAEHSGLASVTMKHYWIDHSLVVDIVNPVRFWWRNSLKSRRKTSGVGQFPKLIKAVEYVEKRTLATLEQVGWLKE